MGDYVYMTVTCARIDIPVFENIGFGFGFTENDPTQTVVTLVDDQANYGHNADIQEIAKRGIPFLYSHEQGGEFGAMLGASAGGVLAECDRDYNSYPVVAYELNGEPCAGALDAVLNYVWYAALALVEMEARGTGVECPTCHGEQWVIDGPTVSTTTCGTCAGTGKVAPS